MTKQQNKTKQKKKKQKTKKNKNKKTKTKTTKKKTKTKTKKQKQKNRSNLFNYIRYSEFPPFHDLHTTTNKKFIAWGLVRHFSFYFFPLCNCFLAW